MAAFLLNYVPILGPLTGVVVFFFVGLFSFSNALWALAPSGVYLLIHILEGETVTPLLLARRFTLNPLLVIAALMFWDWAVGRAGRAAGGAAARGLQNPVRQYRDADAGGPSAWGRTSQAGDLSHAGACELRAKARGGVLLVGPSGCGKSDMVLRLIDRGFVLVADDQMVLDGRMASAPEPLAGLLEIRGLGLLRLPFARSVKLALAVRLTAGERLPTPARYELADVPLVCLHAWPASAPLLVERALDAAMGRDCLGGAGLGGADLGRRRFGRGVVRDGSVRVTMSAGLDQDARAGAVAEPRRLVLVTGLSGGGKASMLRVLEDLGYEAVDNPPLRLMEELAVRGDGPIAIGVDARSRGFDAQEILAIVARLRVRADLRAELVFVFADESVLLRRYTETRRRHPLAPVSRVSDGVSAEIALTARLREAADMLLDTTDLPLPMLRRIVEQRFGGQAGDATGMTVSLTSFAYPAACRGKQSWSSMHASCGTRITIPCCETGPDWMRMWRPTWRPIPDFEPFVDKITDLLTMLLPRFVQEGKKYASVAVGCTGGRHRSVHIVELLAGRLRGAGESGEGSALWRVAVTHRELPAGDRRDGVRQWRPGRDD